MQRQPSAHIRSVDVAKVLNEHPRYGEGVGVACVVQRCGAVGVARVHFDFALAWLQPLARDERTNLWDMRHSVCVRHVRHVRHDSFMCDVCDVRYSSHEPVRHEPLM